MKVSAAILAMCITLLLWCGGCSREEPSQAPGEDYKVVMAVKKPVPEKTEIPLTAEEKPKEEPEDTEEVKPTAIEEEERALSETKTIEKETELQDVSGYYIVKRGDSLSSIAAKDEVYGDPLKWPILYRHNMGKIGELQLVQGFLDRELPEGVRLTIITPDEAQENVRKKANHIWAVNVLSATIPEALIPSAIRLMRENYPVYITSATVKGRNWMRLRVGFFNIRVEADAERRKIMTILSIPNSWVTKVEQRELEEFGGY